MGLVTEADRIAPRISVIIPALNSARTIERCVRSIARQETSWPYEIILVHSGEDDTCRRAALAVPGIRTIQLAARTLAAGARNVGARSARGDILAFLDSDAYADEGWLDAVAHAGESGHDVVCGSIRNANPGSAIARAEQLIMFNEFLAELPARPMWFSLAGNMVLPRSAYQRFGPFVELRAAEDMVFSRRVALSGGRILFTPDMSVFHDNRCALGPFLRNQLVLGKHTAIARRMVPFSRRPGLVLFYLLLLVSPVVKLTKMAWRFARWRPRLLVRIVKELPLLLVGLSAYTIGQITGAFGPIELDRPDRLKRPEAAIT